MKLKSNRAFLLTTLLVTATASVRAQQTPPAASPKPAASAAAVAASPATAASPAATSASPAAKAGAASPAAKVSGGATASPAPAAPAAAPTPQVIVVTTPAAPAPPPGNNWGAGVLGLAILAVGGYYGLRYARGRGVTVADSLKKLGVEMPQDAVATNPQSIAHLRPSPPTVVLPSLTSLSTLPPPEEISTAGMPVNTPGGKPRLVGLAGPVAGQSFALAEKPGPFTVGREADNALALADESTVSRRHARIEPAPTGAGFAIVDEGSSNGTFVNGQRLKVGEPRPLNSGDEVQIGAARLRFEG